MNVTAAISGMALGVDTYFVQVCLELGIPFTAAIPFVGQESKWLPIQQKLYQYLLARAAKIVYVCEPGYERWKMQARNEWIVDHSDHMIAVFDGSPGGTANAVLYAHKVNCPITRINPHELEQTCSEATTQ